MSDRLHAERLARLALSRLTEPGEPRMTRLVNDLGGVAVREQLLAEALDDSLRTDLSVRLGGSDPERDLERAARAGIRFVVPGDEEWPGQVEDLRHPEPLQHRAGVPLGLWVRGPLRLDEIAGSVAVVGSRSATTYGIDAALEIAAHLGSRGRCVVSGGAFGIDQAAHRGVLAGGASTVAVLACGVDRPYPTAHRELLDHIARHGAVVSEAAPGCAPTRIRFLARNRLIAALTRGTVVVEAAIRSGALNTATWADRLSRVLMGVPGPVTSAPSAGVHQMIRERGAALVTCGAEVAELVGGEAPPVAELRAESRARDRLPPRDAQVLEAVPVGRPALAESVARSAGIGLVEVQSALLRLERDGFVARQGRGWRLGHAARDEPLLPVRDVTAS